jgi:hypothetical protein
MCGHGRQRTGDVFLEVLIYHTFVGSVYKDVRENEGSFMGLDWTTMAGDATILAVGVLGAYFLFRRITR